jgi:hypothetical protein
VQVARDGQLEFAAAEGSRVPATAAGSHALAPHGHQAEDRALIASNRQRLAELRAQPYDTVPDFGDALVASAARSLPRLALLMTGVSLEETGLLSDPALLAGAGAFAFAYNWLADRGYEVDSLRPSQAPAGLFYDDLSGLTVWFALDAVRRFLAAATIDDTQLEDELDAYYPRWSRTDFEWGIRRLGSWPVLNDQLFGSGAPRGRATAADGAADVAAAAAGGSAARLLRPARLRVPAAPRPPFARPARAGSGRLPPVARTTAWRPPLRTRRVARART